MNLGSSKTSFFIWQNKHFHKITLSKIIGTSHFRELLFDSCSVFFFPFQPRRSSPSSSSLLLVSSCLNCTDPSLPLHGSQEVHVPGEVFNFMCMCLCAGLVAVLFGIIDAYTPRGRQCQPYPMRAGMFVVLFAIILTRCTSPALPCG